MWCLNHICVFSSLDSQRSRMKDNGSPREWPAEGTDSAGQGFRGGAWHLADAPECHRLIDMHWACCSVTSVYHLFNFSSGFQKLQAGSRFNQREDHPRAPISRAFALVGAMVPLTNVLNEKRKQINSLDLLHLDPGIFHLLAGFYDVLLFHKISPVMQKYIQSNYNVVARCVGGMKIIGGNLCQNTVTSVLP